MEVEIIGGYIRYEYIYIYMNYYEDDIFDTRNTHTHGDEDVILRCNLHNSSSFHISQNSQNSKLGSHGFVTEHKYTRYVPHTYQCHQHKNPEALSEMIF